MIVVHLKQSYPQIRAQYAGGHRREAVLAELAVRTLGDWTGVSDEAIATYGDFIVGVFEGFIVSAYRYTGHHRLDDGLVVFEGDPVGDDWSWLIGCLAPGGKWKRGEARPVRYIDTSEYNDTHKPASSLIPVRDAEQRMIDLVAAVPAAKKPENPTGSDLLDQVEVTLNPRGGIIVSVPATTRVQIVPRVA